MICDFCSNPNVVRQYECMDFDSESKDAGVFYLKEDGPTNMVLASKDFWAACETCSGFVDREDIDGLMAHVIEAFSKGAPPVSPQLAVHLRRTYTLFSKNRIRVTA